MISRLSREPVPCACTVNTTQFIAYVRVGIQRQTAVFVACIQRKTESSVIACGEASVATVDIKLKIFHRVVLRANIAQLIATA